MYSEEEVGEAVAKACEGLWTEAQVQLAVEDAEQKVRVHLEAEHLKAMRELIG